MNVKALRTIANSVLHKARPLVLPMSLAIAEGGLMTLRYEVEELTALRDQLNVECEQRREFLAGGPDYAVAADVDDQAAEPTGGVVPDRYDYDVGTPARALLDRAVGPARAGEPRCLAIAPAGTPYPDNWLGIQPCQLLAGHAGWHRVSGAGTAVQWGDGAPGPADWAAAVDWAAAAAAASGEPSRVPPLAADYLRRGWGYDSAAGEWKPPTSPDVDPNLPPIALADVDPDDRFRTGLSDPPLKWRDMPDSPAGFGTRVCVDDGGEVLTVYSDGNPAAQGILICSKCERTVVEPPELAAVRVEQLAAAPAAPLPDQDDE